MGKTSGFIVNYKKNPEDIRYWFDLLPSDGLDGQNKDEKSDFTLPDSLINDICQNLETGVFHDQPVCEIAIKKGIFSDRNQYLSHLREIAIRLALTDLKEKCDYGEIELMHLVRVLDEIDRSVSKISEKIEELSKALLPYGIDGIQRNSINIIKTSANNPEDPLYLICRDISKLKESRSHIAKSVASLSNKIMPNISSICGPIVAARLLSAAGGRNHLASMSASSLQVLGAGPSLFSHIRSGTPPPKHGIIYGYKGVHHSKRRVRGRVSRVLACQLVIAARIDFYRGTEDKAFLIVAEERICRAKNSS